MFVFIHRVCKVGMPRKCIEEALDSLNMEKQKKYIQKEEQERAVKELISGNDVTSLQDLEILRFVTYVHLPFSVGSHDFFVASLVFMKGTSCCVFKEEFRVEPLDRAMAYFR